MASEKQRRLQTILDSGVVGIIRTERSDRLVRAARALRKGGVTCIEVTMTTPGALEVIEQASSELDDALIGAGSVLDAETARQALTAGATYLVSPIVDRGMIEMAHRYGAVVAPGAFTPTEVMTAWDAGADIVKIFPASRLGPGYIRDIKAPLPQVNLMPTGGVNLENAADFIRAGACALGTGSSLLDKQALADGRFEVLTERAERFVREVKTGREDRS